MGRNIDSGQKHVRSSARKALRDSVIIEEKGDQIVITIDKSVDGFEYENGVDFEKDYRGQTTGKGRAWHMFSWKVD